MKNTILLSILLCSIFNLKSQVSIGTGTQINQQIPIDPSKQFSYSQFIYTVDEMNASGVISGLKFYKSGLNLMNSADWVVSMGHTSKTQFYSSSDWISEGNFIEVFNGVVSQGANGEVEILFSTPFTYNGFDNLVISIDENSVGVGSVDDDFYTSSSSSNQAMVYASNVLNPNPLNPPAAIVANGGLKLAKPNITLLGLSHTCESAFSGLNSQQFTNYLPNCWTEKEGILSANTTFTNNVSSDWDDQNFGNAGLNRGAALNLSYTNHKEWLMSPSFDLGVVDDYLLEFDIALTQTANSSSSTLDPDDIFSVLISTDDGATWSNANTLQSWGSGSEPSNTGDHIIIDLSAYTGVVKIGFYGGSNQTGGVKMVHIDNYMISPLPSCPVVTNTQITNITGTTADLTWSGSAGNVQIEYGTAGFQLGSGISVLGTSNSHTLTGLNAALNYDVYIRAICGLGDTSAWVQGPSFAPTCPGSFSLNYSQNFDTYLPNCWTEKQGVLGASGTTFTDPSSSLWQMSGFAANGNTGAAMLPWSNSVSNQWLISPSIDLGTTIDYQVEFDLALTNWSNAGPAGLLSTDKFVVVISTDNGVTWSQTNALRTWTNGSEPSNNGEFITLDLSAYTGVVKIGFYGERAVSSFNVLKLFIDNFQIKPIGTCPKPALVTINTIQDNTIQLSWTNGASQTEIEYGPTGFTPGIGQGIVIVTSSNPFNLTGLTEQTDYEVYVRDICGVGDTSAYTMPRQFTTTCSVITPTYSQDFANWFPACWSQMQGRLGISNTTIIQNDYSYWVQKGFGNIGYTGATGVQIYGNSTQEWLISPSFDLGTGNNYQLSFHVAATSASGTSPANFSPDDSLAVVISTDNGLTWKRSNILRLWLANSQPSNTGDIISINLSAYSGTIKIGFYAASTVNGGSVNAYIDNFIIGPAQSCSQASITSVSNIGADNATVSWTGATNAELEYGPAGFPVGTGTTIVTNSNPYTLTNLLPLTNYQIYIKKICGIGDTSYVSTGFSFSTTCGIYTPSYSQDFLEYLPTCWSEMQGLLGNLGTVITNSNSFNWNSDAIGNTSFQGGAGCVTASSVKDWLVSPSINLGSGTAYQLEFIVSATGLSTTNAAEFDSNDTLAIVISTDNGLTWRKSNILKAWTNANIPLNTGEYVVLDLSSYSGLVKFGFYVGSSSGTVTNEIQLDDFRILPLESCFTPIDIEVMSVTDVSALISWGSASVNAEIEYGPAGFQLGTGTRVVGTTNPMTISGLSDNTDYTFYIRSICGLGDTSNWSMSNTFKTNCPVYQPPYYNDMSVSPPYCWTKMRGTLGATSTVVTDPSYSSWYSGYFGFTALGTLCSNVNLSSTYEREWLISPSFDLGIGNNYHLEFDIALTSSSSSAAVNFGADDSLVVVISTDNGITWSLANALMIFDVANQPSNTGDFISIDISAYSGIVKFGFYAKSSVSGTGVRISIDNFEIPLCGAPINVNLGAVSSSTASITWLQESPSSNFEYGPTGYTQGTGTLSNSTNGSVSLNGLTPTTTYDYYIQNDCGSGSLSHWAGPFSFATTCPEYVPTYTEDFTSYLPYCWEEKEGVLGSVNTIFTNNSSTTWTEDGFGNNGFTGAAKVNFSGTGGDEWLISPTIDLGNGSIDYQVQFDVALTTWANTDLDVLGADDTLAFLISTDNGLTWKNANILKRWTAGSEPTNYGELIISELQSYSGLVKFGFYMATTVTGGNVNMYIDNFEVKAIPSCQQPLNVVLNSVTSTTAEVSWTVGASNSFVEYGPSGFVPGSGTRILSTTANQLISGLLPNTNYDIYVMDSCGIGDVSSWTGPISFRTQCELIIPDYLENFTTMLPDCWSKFQGELGLNSTLVSNPYSSSWTEDGFGNVTSIGSASLNIYSPASNGSRFDWLVSPSIDLGDGTTDYLLEFDLASTYFINTNPADFDTDDSLSVVISTDNGTTWSSSNRLRTWRNTNEPSATGDHITISLLGYTGAVKLAFYGSTRISGGNVNVYVDNFEIKSCVPSASSITEVACDSYTAASGTIYTTSGIFTDAIMNAMGCDSIVTIDLTINQSSTNSINASVCDEYLSNAGNLYTTTEIYTETFINTQGCDSTLTLNLDITNTNLTVTQTNGVLLTSNAGPGVQYQWVDCNNGNQPIQGENSATFTATINGEYACEITNGACVSLTDCYVVNNVDLHELNKLSFAIYPNPTSELVTIETDGDPTTEIAIVNLVGEIIYQGLMNSNKKTIDVSNFSSGVYVVKLTNKQLSTNLFFTIER